MTKETKNNGHPEGSIYELFVYTPKLSAYPNISDIYELSEIARTNKEKRGERYGKKC